MSCLKDVTIFPSGENGESCIHFLDSEDLGKITIFPCENSESCIYFHIDKMVSSQETISIGGIDFTLID